MQEPVEASFQFFFSVISRFYFGSCILKSVSIATSVAVSLRPGGGGGGGGLPYGMDGDARRKF